MEGQAHTARRYWWVNQSNSFTDEWRHGCLAAPQHDGHGRTYPFWQRMRMLRPGDVALHHYRGQLVAVSRITAAAIAGTRPYRYLGKKPNAPDWVASAEYTVLSPAIDVRDIDGEWWTMAEGPFTESGRHQEGYLYGVTPEFVRYLERRFGLKRL